MPHAPMAQIGVRVARRRGRRRDKRFAYGKLFEHSRLETYGFIAFDPGRRACEIVDPPVAGSAKTLVHPCVGQHMHPDSQQVQIVVFVSMHCEVVDHSRRERRVGPADEQDVSLLRGLDCPREPFSLSLVGPPAIAGKIAW